MSMRAQDVKPGEAGQTLPAGSPGAGEQGPAEGLLRACRADGVLRARGEGRVLRRFPCGGLRMPVAAGEEATGGRVFRSPSSAPARSAWPPPPTWSREARPARARGRADASAPASATWGHVRLFSPWRYNVDPAARGAARRRGLGGARSGRRYPTGRELVERYLAPLAALPAIRPAPAPRHPRARGEPRRASTR